MADYDFTNCLSPLDFELLSKDLLEAELGIQLENFSEGRDKGIDLRYSPIRSGKTSVVQRKSSMAGNEQKRALIVQCKRYATFASLKSELKRKELAKIIKLEPERYILTTSASLSPQNVDELKLVLAPFVQSTGDVYGRERLNGLLVKHPEIERRHIKLWATSSGVLDSIVNAGTHTVSREEVERTIAAAKIYVRNTSFDEALAILKKHHVCIISGLPGIGKTTLARMLLLYFYQRDFDVVKIESDISEARSVAYHKRPRFYYYDDFLGQTAQADKLNKNEDQKLLDFIASVRDSKDSVFVLTTREYILNQAKLHYEKLAREKFDHRTCIIDLNKYSRRIRAQILYNHLHFSDLPRQYLKKLVAKRGYLQIIDHKNYNPRLVQYLTDPAWVGETPFVKYLALFLRTLDNPVEIWEHAFRNQLSDRARHLLFILTTMPLESLMADVELAFSKFHKSQCANFGIPYSAADFKTALKELDGTFVATRKVQESVLLSFQNPSIRDFMQNILLGGELLTEIIESLIFFEQAQWLVETLNDKHPRISVTQLVQHSSKILDALQRLIEANGCSIAVEGPDSWQRIHPKATNPAERVAMVASSVASRKSRADVAWIEQRISDLAVKVKTGNLTVLSVVKPAKTFKRLGFLKSKEGRQLELVLKRTAMTNTYDLDDFEVLAELHKVLPRSFAKSEIFSIRNAYSKFADRHATECDLGDPDELRDEATRLGNVGEVFKVNTDQAEDTLKEFAREIEKKEKPSWSSILNELRVDKQDSCSDAELDSMFGTLRD